MTDANGPTTSDRVKPWTIKSIAPEERNAAIAAADRAGQTIGEWLTRAIRSQVQADHQADKAPVMIERAVIPKVDQSADLVDLERLVGLAERIANANGKPIPPGITRATHAVILRAIRAGRIARRV